MVIVGVTETRVLFLAGGHQHGRRTPPGWGAVAHRQARRHRHATERARAAGKLQVCLNHQ